MTDQTNAPGTVNIADIKKDREVGTIGPWRTQEDFLNVYALSGGTTGITTAIAKLFKHEVEGGKEEALANLRRVARVPEMEEALIAAADLAPRVKELEWTKVSGLLRYEAESVDHVYIISFDDRANDDVSWSVFLLGVWVGLPSLKEAKAAAQADYERRILSAIDMQPVSPEVAAGALLDNREALSQIVDDVAHSMGAGYGAGHAIKAALGAIKGDAE